MCVARQDCEALETETKRFEDLEFQQLERESRQDEEKETHTQQLLREIADYQRSTVTRKVVESRSSGSHLVGGGASGFDCVGASRVVSLQGFLKRRHYQSEVWTHLPVQWFIFIFTPFITAGAYLRH